MVVPSHRKFGLALQQQPNSAGHDYAMQQLEYQAANHLNLNQVVPVNSFKIISISGLVVASRDNKLT